jgi:hypothetical protein
MNFYNIGSYVCGFLNFALAEDPTGFVSEFHHSQL